MPDVDLPPPTAALVERARAFRDAGQLQVPAKPSATVILLRDGLSAGSAGGPGAAVDPVEPGAGLEVFMIRRHVAMSFAAGMHVFPGGVVDPADGVGRGDDDALVVAAIRETFEESGVLLATGPVGDPGALEADRLALIAHQATLDEVLARHGLVLRPQSLRRWAHWITPEFEPRRYDTSFYVALAPSDPRYEARYVGGESDAAQWVRPSAALAAQHRGEWVLMPPTEMTLRELADFVTAADAFAAAEHRNIRPLLPTVDLDADPPTFVFEVSR